jgi:hypothetical protein
MLRISLEAKQEPLADILTRILKPEGLQWLVRHGDLVVTRWDRGQHLTGFLSVPDEIAAAVRSGIMPQNGDPPTLAEDCLRDLILELCEPADGWDAAGPRTINVLRTAGSSRLVLVISHTFATHQRVRQVLETLRKRSQRRDELRPKLKEIQDSVRERLKSGFPLISVVPVVG